MANSKILILGGSSYIGKHLATSLGTGSSIATYRSNPIEGGVFFDALSGNLGEVLDDPKAFSHAVVLLGQTKPEACAADPEAARKLNIDSIKVLLGFLKQHHIKPVFASTESVFDGSKGDYIESDAASPLLTYGLQKLEMETYLEEEFEDHLIVRLSLCYGLQKGDGTVFSNWLDDILKGKALQCARDQTSSPIYIGDAVEGIVQLMSSGARGLFHVSGTTAFSKLDMGEILATQVRSHSQLSPQVVSRSIREFPVLEPRPLNVSMRSDKLVNATGLEIHDLEDICGRLIRSAFQN